MTLEGVDFSFGRPGGAALVAAGKHFVVRYVPYSGDGGKGLTTAEVADYHGHGLAIALVFESVNSRALLGFAAGAADAHTSQVALMALGAPLDLPIYFAVDWNATAAQQPAIDDYLRGAVSVLGLARVGIYGGVYVIQRCQVNGTASRFWQTYAWSAGQVAGGVHLLQYLNGQSINGAAVDLCRAYQADFGQWAPVVEDALTLDKITYQSWTANGTDGVLRDKPDRSLTPSVRLPAGTTIISIGEYLAPDGNNWRAAEWPVGSHTVRWFLRYGPGIPADHDFIAGPFVSFGGDLLAAKQAGYDLAVTGVKVTNTPTVTFPPRPS